MHKRSKAMQLFINRLRLLVLILINFLPSHLGDCSGAFVRTVLGKICYWVPVVTESDLLYKHCHTMQCNAVSTKCKVEHT